MFKNKESIVRNGILALAFFAGWFGFSYINQVSGGVTMSNTWIFSVIAMSLIAVIVGMIINIILHEFGHLLGGLLTGWRFVYFGIFNLLFIKEDGKVVRKTAQFQDAAGICRMAPPEMKNGTLPHRLYLFGGVFMNLVCMAVCAVLFFHFAPSAPFWARAFLIAGLAGAFIVATNLIPGKTGHAMNDGYLLLHLGKPKNTEMRLRFWRNSNLVALRASGVRARDIPTAYFEWANRNERISDPFVLEAALLPYEHLIDKGEMEEARAYLQLVRDCLDNSLETFMPAIDLHLLFHELINECREEKINRLYTAKVRSYAKASAGAEGVQRVLYAYARLFTKDEAAAKEHLKLFEKACKNSADIGSVHGQRELIALVDKIAEQRAKEVSAE